jgi:hypothetical protein
MSDENSWWDCPVHRIREHSSPKPVQHEQGMRCTPLKQKQQGISWIYREIAPALNAHSSMGIE